MKNEDMAINTRFANETLSNLDKAWTRQRQMVDTFVAQTNEKVKLLEDHDITTASDTGSRACHTDRLHNSLRPDTSELSDLVNIQTDQKREIISGSTTENLEEIEKNHIHSMSDTSQLTDINTMISELEGKENIGKEAY